MDISSNANIDSKLQTSNRLAFYGYKVTTNKCKNHGVYKAKLKYIYNRIKSDVFIYERRSHYHTA